MQTHQHVTQQEHLLDDDTTLMTTTDADSYITYANSAFIEVSGYDRSEIDGQPHNLVRHPDMPKAAFAETLYVVRPWSAQVPRAVSAFIHWLREAFAHKSGENC